MIGFLESVAIAKAFARKNKYKVDPSQELIALGLANFIGAFCSAYPVTGSFSRTAVNSISGVATPLGGKCEVLCRFVYSIHCSIYQLCSESEMW